jgi:hypothetical protein
LSPSAKEQPGLATPGCSRFFNFSVPSDSFSFHY